MCTFCHSKPADSCGNSRIPLTRLHVAYSIFLWNKIRYVCLILQVLRSACQAQTLQHWYLFAHMPYVLFDMILCLQPEAQGCQDHRSHTCFCIARLRPPCCGVQKATSHGNSCTCTADCYAADYYAPVWQITTQQIILQHIIMHLYGRLLHSRLLCSRSVSLLCRCYLMNKPGVRHNPQRTTSNIKC